MRLIGQGGPPAQALLRLPSLALPSVRHRVPCAGLEVIPRDHAFPGVLSVASPDSPGQLQPRGGNFPVLFESFVDKRPWKWPLEQQHTHSYLPPSP